MSQVSVSLKGVYPPLPSVYTMKITQEETDIGVIVRMQVMLLYGPEVWIDVEPDTAVYVRRPR